MNVKDVRQGSLHIYSRWPLHVSARWPGEWGLYVNWKDVYFNAGEPTQKFHRGGEMPESRFKVSMGVAPLRLIIFWNNDRILWLGDRKWKAELKKDW